MATPSLVDALALFGLRGENWAAWRAVAKCLDGQGAMLTPDERALFEASTGRASPPMERPAEVVIVAGRRSGKSRFAGVAAARAAGLMRYPLAPGERAVVGLAAADRAQARILLGYAAAPFETGTLRGLVRRPSPLARLADLVTRRTRWGFDLTTGTSVEVRTASYGSIRGRSYALVVADEVAFWSADDGSNPASEVLAAVRPGLVTLDGQLLVISSPYAKAGPLWDAVERYYGRDDDRVLVWRAPTRTMNPTIPQAVVDDALRRDEAAARAEWEAEFREDQQSYVGLDTLRRVVVPGQTRWPRHATLAHVAIFDGATGTGSDSSALAIAHRDTIEGRPVAVLDALLEVRPPFSPRGAVEQAARLAHEYGCTEVYGDAFAAGWVEEAFRSAGLRYRPLATPKAEVYVMFLQLITSEAVRLLDAPRLVAQLTGLVRRARPGGRDVVDHAARGHDDVANVTAAACVVAWRSAREELFAGSDLPSLARLIEEGDAERRDRSAAAIEAATQKAGAWFPSDSRPPAWGETRWR